MSQLKNPVRRFFDFICEEPLIPFAVIGGILFALYGLFAPATKERIEIQPQTVQALEEMEIELRGRPLTDIERQLVIDSHIEDEVLMREAFRQELEKKDSRVRKRLLTVMRASLDEPVGEPTPEQLRKYYQQEAAKYGAGEALTFDQVYFSFGGEPADNVALIQSLKDGKDHRQLGDQHFLGSSVKQLTADRIRRTYGSDFADKLFALESDIWTGPLESRDGFHFIRVIRREEIAPPTFEQLGDFLRQDWMFNKRRETQTRKIAEMSNRYEIEMVGQDQ